MFHFEYFSLCKKNEEVSQYVHFGSKRVHIDESLKIIGMSYKLQPSLIKQ